MNDTFVKGQWYHIVISCASNGLIKTYVNGIEKNQWTNQSKHCFYEGNLANFRMCIGGDMSVDNLQPSECTRACENPFPGYIAVTRIYEDALTDTQSKGLFTKFMAGQ